MSKQSSVNTDVTPYPTQVCQAVTGQITLVSNSRLTEAYRSKDVKQKAGLSLSV